MKKSNIVGQPSVLINKGIRAAGNFDRGVGQGINALNQSGASDVIRTSQQVNKIKNPVLRGVAKLGGYMGEVATGGLGVRATMRIGGTINKLNKK